MLTISRRLLTAAAVALLMASCTADSRYKLRQPTGDVQLEGALNKETAPADSHCPTGTLVYWGHVKNVGDIDVQEVRFVVDVFNGAGGSLGSFSADVFGASLTPDASGNAAASTNLIVDQVGTFLVCTGLSPGAAARAEYHAKWVVFETTTTTL
jgi:hypothetical protein